MEIAATIHQECVTAILSLGTLPPIALPAQHLAIFGDGAATLFPWGDVVNIFN